MASTEGQDQDVDKYFESFLERCARHENNLAFHLKLQQPLFSHTVPQNLPHAGASSPASALDSPLAPCSSKHTLVRSNLYPLHPRVNTMHPGTPSRVTRRSSRRRGTSSAPSTAAPPTFSGKHPALIHVLRCALSANACISIPPSSRPRVGRGQSSFACATPHDRGEVRPLARPLTA